jgi:hypothetical protein
LLFVGAAILCSQVLIPPYIGIADNGDFAKVARRLSLVPSHPEYGYRYINSDYVYSPRSRWKSDVHSSEQVPALVAFRMSRVHKDGDVFNIRWMGLVHGVLFLAAFGVLLLATRPFPLWPSLVVRVAALFIFTDVLYVSYFNSFYSDAAALVGLLGTVAAALLILTGRLEAWTLILYTAFALLLVGSKSQHAFWALLPTAFLVVVTRRSQRLWIRFTGRVCAALLLVAAAATLYFTPVDYKAQARFNLIFFKLGKLSDESAEDLVRLGLSPGDVCYFGFTAYAPGSPAEDPKWFADFCRKTSYLGVAKLYVRRPSLAFRVLAYDFQTFAPCLRLDFSNYRREDATRPGQRATRFAWWSDLRMGAYLRWPSHIVLWYALLASGIIWIIRSRWSATSTVVAWLTAGIAAAGIAEFCVSSLADACETSRHLFLFHALTDITVCIATGAVAHDLEARTSASPRKGPRYDRVLYDAVRMHRQGPWARGAVPATSRRNR